MSGKVARHALEYGAFRVVSAVLRFLPERAALGLGGALGWFAGSVLGIRRSTVDANLRIAFPDRDRAWRRRVARASWVHLGREAVTTFRMADLDGSDLLARSDFTGLEAFREAVAAGRGVVLVSGHLGNWEIGGAALAAHGIPVDAVAKAMGNPRFDQDLVAVRARLGLRIVEMSEARREIPLTLRAGRVAGLVADQNKHRAGLFVPFFGVPAATARGPALYALRAGAPVFVGVALRKPGWPPRYRMILEPVALAGVGSGGAPAGPDRASDTGSEADVRALTEAHVAVLERFVREAPEQYFWQHKRWKTRPAEEQPPQAAV